MRKSFRGIFARVAICVACTVGVAHADGTLRLGLVPSEDPRAAVQDNRILVEHLQSALHMDVTAFAATDYGGTIEALRSKKLDVALLGPFSYVLAAAVANVEAFALMETDKQGGTYRSLIIARKDRGLRSFKDLAGKTFAFVDPGSTSGYLFPRAALVRDGFDPDKFFSRVMFSGGHDASAIAVQNGKVDAAAVADPLLDIAVGRGLVNDKDLTVLWRSEPIPGVPAVYRRDLPADLKAGIRAAFARIRDMPWGKATVKRWVPTDDAAYDGVRQTAKVLDLDLSKLK